MSLRKKVRDAMEKAGANMQITQEFRSIFDVAGVPAFNQFYTFGIFPWKYVYKGFYSPWGS